MLCRYFMTEQGCRNGDHCTFIHTSTGGRQRSIRGRQSQRATEDRRILENPAPRARDDAHGNRRRNKWYHHGKQKDSDKQWRHFEHKEIVREEDERVQRGEPVFHSQECGLEEDGNAPKQKERINDIKREQESECLRTKSASEQKDLNKEIKGTANGKGTSFTTDNDSENIHVPDAEPGDTKVTQILEKSTHKQQSINERKPRNQICKYWFTKSSCYWGDNCKYLHPKEGELKRTGYRQRSEGKRWNDGKRHDFAVRPKFRVKIKDAKEGKDTEHKKENLMTSCNSSGQNDQVKQFTPSPINTPECKCLPADPQSEDIVSEVTLGKLGSCETIVASPENVKTLGRSDQMGTLRDREIGQLKRRFDQVGCFQELLVDNKDIYQIIWHPTDPDWMFSVSLQDSEELPDGFARYLSNEMLQWVEHRKKSRQEDDLAVRPFLKWFDKSLIAIFTKAAKQVKRDLAAKQAGVEFIPYGMVPVKCDIAEGNSESLGDGHATKHIEDREQERVPSSNNEEVIPGDNVQALSDIALDVDGSKLVSDFNNQCKTNESNSEHVSGIALTSTSSIKNGIELKFAYVNLSEHVASLTAVVLDLEIECRRCKTRETMLIKGTRSTEVICQKCRNLQRADFQPSLLHHFSPTIGFIHPFGCKPFDLILVNSIFQLCCLNCDKDNEIKGLMFGQPRAHWCQKCHAKMELQLSSCRFVDHSPAAASVELKQVHTAKPKVPREPGIREGQPLMDNGTCKHYKKSFRWLRFPCCGKCYPCDVCHDEKEDHEMKFAGRMICGFCSKEQPFHMEKPCVSCGTNLKKGKTQHWEGGTGCRNQKKMSRNDKQKYAGKNKTMSRKATQLEEKKSKKTTSNKA